MGATPVYISFDYDNDEDLKILLVGQSRYPDSPFVISDWSIKEAVPDWRIRARQRIQRVDVVVVLCGLRTRSAKGVSDEIEIAQSLDIPYFLLAGRKAGGNERPASARPSDKLYNWTWENLKNLIGGAR